MLQQRGLQVQQGQLPPGYKLQGEAQQGRSAAELAAARGSDSVNLSDATLAEIAATEQMYSEYVNARWVDG